MTAFQVAIGRVQQCALEKAKQRVPTPEEQLALLRNKQGKKQRVILNFSYASLIDFNIFFISWINFATMILCKHTQSKEI